jgi:hypothetical protein
MGKLMISFLLLQLGLEPAQGFRPNVFKHNVNRHAIRRHDNMIYLGFGGL